MRFLWWVGSLTLLVVVLAVLYRLFETQIQRWAMVPGMTFANAPVDARPDYRQINPRSWIARPGLVPNPALEAPPGFRAAPKPPVDVFFIPPTSYYRSQRWNAPLDDKDANAEWSSVARQMASAFNGVGAIYMPRYRQATLGTFYAMDTPDAVLALELAYGDVLAAFDAFQAARGIAKGPQRPFILASHSQGSLHALRLLKDRFDVPLNRQNLVAAYIIGWPVSVAADLTPLGLKPCQTPQAINCVLSWQSFGAQGADTKALAHYIETSTSYFGVPYKNSRPLCNNPITGWMDGKDGSREANLGALALVAPSQPLPALLPRVTGASCADNGFLMLSPNPGVPFEARKISGENYHSYDYALFWANIRANAEARVSAFYAPR